MSTAWRLAFTTVVAAAFISLSLAQQEAAQVRGQVGHQVEYESWLRPLRTTAMTTQFWDPPAQRWVEQDAILAVTAIERDEPEPPPPADKAAGLGRSGWVRVGGGDVRHVTLVSTAGLVAHETHHSMGTKGGGAPALPAEQMARLDALLAALPESVPHLPPPNRRLVVRVEGLQVSGMWVYDRAELPEAVLDVLRMTHSHIRSWVPEYKLQNSWKAGESDNWGSFIKSPDGRTVVSAARNGPIRVWDPNSHELIPDAGPSAPEPSFALYAGLTLSPDGSVAAGCDVGEVSLFHTQTWTHFRQIAEPLIDGHQIGLSNPVFTPDGRYLLLQGSEPTLKAFDTTTWQQQPIPAEIPQGALAYYPSGDRQRAVYATRNGTITLWDPLARRDVGVLDVMGKVESLAFSPDQTLVAVATVQEVKEENEFLWYRLRIWEASDGTMLRELLPFEQRAYQLQQLLWSPDGQYLLAATRTRVNSEEAGVSIFSLATGRHRAQLPSCAPNSLGLALLADGRLYQGCGDGMIREWNAATILHWTRVFEASLATVK